MRFHIPILAAVLILASTHATAVVQLSLKADSMVKGPRLTLGDVATFEEGDKGEAQALAAIDLGGAPLPGYTDRFTRKEIDRLIRSRGLNSVLIWHGADAVRVERIATVFNTEQIAQSAEMYLRQLLLDDVTRVTLQLSEPLVDLQLPNGKVELKPRAMPPAQAMHRRVTVWVDVMVDGVFVRSVTVPFNVQAYRSVLVAKRDLPKGAIPQCDALQLREQDVAALDSVPAPADCQTVQRRLKHALTQGTPLLKAYLHAPVAVAQGDNVSLQMIDGALMLESRAVAMVDGEVGQRINVKPSAATETIVAEVIAPGVVKVTGK